MVCGLWWLERGVLVCFSVAWVSAAGCCLVWVVGGCLWTSAFCELSWCSFIWFETGWGVGLAVSVVLVFTFWLASVVVVLDCVGFGCLAVWALW